MAKSSQLSKMTVEAASALTFEAERGQRVRFVQSCGLQPMDVVAFGKENITESPAIWLTRQFSRDFTSAAKIYSKYPFARPMFSVTHSPTNGLWLSGGTCNALTAPNDDGSNCHDLLTQAIKRAGLSPEHLPDVINLFIRPEFQPDGTYKLLAADVDVGDYVELQPELDVVICVTSCPSTTPFNPSGRKPASVEIWGD